MRKSRDRMSKIDPSTNFTKGTLFQAFEGGGDRILEQFEVAEFMAEHKREPGQEQRLTLGAGRIDCRCQRFISRFEVFEGHHAHGLSLPRQMRAVRTISPGTAVLHRPAMCRSGRSR